VKRFGDLELITFLRVPRKLRGIAKRRGNLEARKRRRTKPLRDKFLYGLRSIGCSGSRRGAASGESVANPTEQVPDNRGWAGSNPWGKLGRAYLTDTHILLMPSELVG